MAEFSQSDTLNLNACLAPMLTGDNSKEFADKENRQKTTKIRYMITELIESLIILLFGFLVCC